MHPRSKSQPDFHNNHMLHYFSRDEERKSLSTVYPELDKATDIYQVKNVIADILEDRSSSSNKNSGDSRGKGNDQKEQMHFLESKLFAARRHIKELEQKNQKGMWKHERIQDVSAAMKQYIESAEQNEADSKERIKMLEKQIEKSSKLLIESELKLEQHRSELTNKMNQQQLEMSQKISALEKSLRQRDDEVCKLEKDLHLSNTALANVRGEKDAICTDIEVHELQYADQINSLRAMLQQEKENTRQLKDETESQNLKINAFQSYERNLTNEIKILQKEASESKANIKRMEEGLNSKEVVFHKIALEKEECDKRISQLSDNEKYLQTQIASFQSQKSDSQSDFVDHLKADNLALKSEVKSLIKEKDSQREAITELQKSNNQHEQCCFEQEEKLRNWQLFHEENLEREHQVQMECKEKQKCEAQSSEEIAEVVKKFSKVEELLRRDLTEAQKSLKSKGEEIQMLKGEKEQLKGEFEEFIRALKDENKDLQSKNKGMEISGATLQMQHESCMRDNTSYKKSLQKLTIELKEKIDILNDSKVKYELLLKEREEASSKAKDHEKCQQEKDELHRTIKLLSSELEDCKNDKKNLFFNEFQMRDALADKSNAYQDLMAMNEQLREDIERAKQREKCYAQKEMVSERRIGELQNECNHLDKSLKELKEFMTYSRAEIELIRVEHQNEEKAKELLHDDIANYQHELTLKDKKIESFKENLMNYKVILEQLHQQSLEWQSSKSELTSEIKEYQEQIKVLTEKNLQLNPNLNDLRIAGKKLKLELKVKEDEIVTLRKQCNKLVQSLEEAHQKIFEVEQTVKEEGRELDESKKTINKLLLEFEKSKQEVQYHQQKIEQTKETERVNRQKMQDTQEKIEKLESKIETISEEKLSCEEQLRCQMRENSEFRNSLKNVGEQIQELMQHKQNLLEKVGTAKQQAASVNEQLEKKTKELEVTKLRETELEFMVKELESQIKLSSDSAKKLQSQNSQLTTALQCLKEKQESSQEESHMYTMSFKDLQNENTQLKSSSKTMEHQNSTLKATVTELQGIVDGNNHKHSWIMQHGQDQGNEIKYLKEGNHALQQQLFELKEKLARAEFDNEKLHEELNAKKTDLENILRDNESLQKEMINMSKLHTENTIALESDIFCLEDNFAKKSDELDTLRQDYDKVVKSSCEQENKLNILQEKHEFVLKQLEDLKHGEVGYMDKQKTAENCFNVFKNEIRKLVTYLRDMKHERDSIKALLQASENDNLQYQTCIKSVQMEFNKTKKDLAECKHENKRISTENESLKSKLSILKFTEATREGERKETISKLRQYECKLNSLKPKNTDIRTEKVPEINENPKESSTTLLHSQMINDLKNMVTTKESISASYRTKDELLKLKEILQSIDGKEKSKKGQMHARKVTSKDHVTSCSCSRHNKANSRNISETRNRTIDDLYKESKALQDSLLAMLSEMSKKFTIPIKTGYEIK